MLSRGQGHGLSQRTSGSCARVGFRRIIEAWANLYTEFAYAVAARRDQRVAPAGWLGMPGVRDGLAGVRFIEATVRSNAQDGALVEV